MIFQLFVILNKVSKSAEIAFLEFQLLILQKMEHGNIFFFSWNIFQNFRNFEISSKVQKEQLENAAEQQSQSKPEYEAGLAK